MNIDYKYPPSLAKAALNHALKTVGYGCFTTKTVNNGYGEKYLLHDGTSLIVYFKKGMSSTIISEKMPDETALLILKELKSYINGHSGGGSAANALAAQRTTPYGSTAKDLSPQKATKIGTSTKVTSRLSGLNRITADIPTLASHVGSDESGKGDFFGGISIAAVYLTIEQENELTLAGVRDSKALTDDKIVKLRNVIYSVLGEDCVACMCLTPTQYNDYYPKYNSNVNFLLARAHCMLIEKLLVAHNCDNVIIDQFCEESLINQSLGALGKKAKILLTPKGERDVAVAAASIVARANYVEQMDKLSATAGFNLAKGANDIVISQANELIATFGKDCLKDYVKLHFRTTQRLD